MFNRISHTLTSPCGAIVVFIVLALVRILAANYYWFFEQDEIGIAVGVAALVRGNDGDLYRYGPQLGYYRLVQCITHVFGGQVMTIPVVMITLSAISGAAIPALTLRVFRATISPSLQESRASSLLQISPQPGKSLSTTTENAHVPDPPRHPPRTSLGR